MDNKYSDDPMLKLVSLSEEILSLNIKIKQMVMELQANRASLAGLKELSNELNKKMGDFKTSVNNYKAPPMPENEESTPSYEGNGNTERIRVIPTPENYEEIRVQSKPIVEVATAAVANATPDVTVTNRPTKVTKNTVKKTRKTTKTSGRKVNKGNLLDRGTPTKDNRPPVEKKKKAVPPKAKKRGFFGGNR